MDDLVQRIHPVPAEQNKQEAKREFIELLKMALVFLLVFWVMKTFVIEGYEVQGESMFPTLEDRDRILVLKLPHELSKITLFGFIHPFDDSDIIVFEGEGNKRYVKRVIAHNPRLSGNRVNAKLMDDAADSDPIVKVEYDRGVVRVNNWQIDETQYLPEEAKTTRDKNLCVLHPGEYYVLGDHRRVSKDSRSFSAVSESQIVGKAVLRFWPLSKFGLL